MTGARGARRSDPTRIGQVRPSHLVTTSGVGAVVDLPAMSVVVRGLDAWSAERQEMILEPRLLEEVRRVVGDSVRTLRSAPWDPQATDDPWTRVGVPVTPFPGWVRCPRCFRLGPLHGSQQFTLVHRYGRRPDLAKIVHAQCQHQAQTRDANKRRCVPARFLVACEAGHLDDFPYVQFVHSANATPCGGPKLTMQDSASTLGPRVTIRCAECGASRNVQAASGRDGSANLPRCRGRHPHLQVFEQCGRPLRLIVLGASNLWFGVTASALHLPLLASYAMHSEPALAAALSRAVQRGVRITFVAERAADNPSFHGPRVAFAHVPARRLRWPADRRPAGACLHAKILVVDRIVALVGSANVTTSAMERNLECGVLVRDRIVAADIARHVDELVRAGELMPLPGEGQ